MIFNGSVCWLCECEYVYKSVLYMIIGENVRMHDMSRGIGDSFKTIVFLFTLPIYSFLITTTKTLTNYNGKEKRERVEHCDYFLASIESY